MKKLLILIAFIFIGASIYPFDEILRIIEATGYHQDCFKDNESCGKKMKAKNREVRLKDWVNYHKTNFKLMDSNKDGKVSRKEFKKYINSL